MNLFSDLHLNFLNLDERANASENNYNELKLECSFCNCQKKLKIVSIFTITFCTVFTIVFIGLLTEVCNCKYISFKLTLHENQFF